jgi:hypothetical protein
MWFYIWCAGFFLYCLCGDIMFKHSIRTNSNSCSLFFIYVENVQDVVKGMTPTPGLHQCLIIVKFHEFSCLDIFYFSPPILPFVLVYFCFGYFIFRNQVRISHFFSSYVFVPLTYHYEPASSSKGQ